MYFNENVLPYKTCKWEQTEVERPVSAGWELSEQSVLNTDSFLNKKRFLSNFSSKCRSAAQLFKSSLQFI